MRHSLQQIDIRWYAALSSLLMSLVAAMLGLLPNNDAYTYLRTAEIVLEDGLAAAYVHYPWATYSVLMAGIQHLPGIDLFAAAQLLNAVLYVLLTVSFISIVQEADSSKRVAILAALTILVYPHVNELRDFLIRDIGYLAFSLLALLHIIRYSRRGYWPDAALFCTASLVAVLFRPEALLFLVIAPFSLLLNRDQTLVSRARGFMTVQGFSVALILSTVVLFLLPGINLLSRLTEFLTTYAPFLEQSTRILDADREQLSQALFTDHAAMFSEQYLTLFVVSGLSAILVAKLLEGFGILFLGMLLYGYWQRMCHIPRHVALPVAAYLLTALLILFAFVLLTRFLTTRYTLLFCTVMVIFVPLIIDRAWRKAERNSKLRRFSWIAGFLLLYNVMDAHISFGEPKTYTTEALQWLLEHTDSAAPLLSNEEYIAWKSGRVADYDRVHREMPVEPFLTSQPGSILVIQREERFLAAVSDAEASGELALLQTFDDRRGPRIFIYERQ